MFTPDGLHALPELQAGVVAPPGIACQDQPSTDASGDEFAATVCVIPSLAPLASQTFTWRFAIPPNFPGSPDLMTPALVDVAVAFVFPPVDTNPDNNVASVSAVVTAQADVAVTKTGPAAVVAGSVVSYFIRVLNNGSRRPRTSSSMIRSQPG